MKFFKDFSSVITHAKDTLLGDLSYEIPAGRWQGTEEYSGEVMKEFFNYIFTARMHEDRGTLAIDTKADLPWAEEHFQERVGGTPMNPGLSYRIWPYNKFKDKEDKFARHGDKFSHTYMERFWPKKAGHDDRPNWKYKDLPTRKGIRFEYGDLNDVINQLADNLSTRQAYLPIFFPEDTGAVDGQRVPCSIGYHFMIRAGYIHVNYYIRSCDFYRHFKNDIYLTARLAMHIRDSLETRLAIKLQMGFLTMHIGSFHLFKNDIYLIKKGNY